MICFGKPPVIKLPAKRSIPSESLVPRNREIRSDNLTCICDGPPGLCVTGGTEKNVVLNDYENRHIVHEWTGHRREISKVAFGKRKNIAISGSRDKLINIWQVNRKCSPAATLLGHELVITGLAISPKTNDFACSGSRDNSVKLWDVNKGLCVKTTTLSRNLVTHLTWSPTADLIIQTSEDKEVKMWDPHNLEIIHSFPKKTQIQTCCDVHRMGKYCITSSTGFNGNGCEATLWDLRQRKIIHEYHGHRDGIIACMFLQRISGSSVILTISKDDTLRIWERDEPTCIAILPMDNVGLMTGITAPTAETVLVSTFKQGIRVIKVTDQEEIELETVDNF